MSPCSVQVAKDMERWAKSVNAAKATQKQQLKALIQLERAEVAARGDTAGDQQQQQQQQQQLSLGTEVRRSGISLTAALEVSHSFPLATTIVVRSIMWRVCVWRVR